jgi:hypothetical protein
MIAVLAPHKNSMDNNETQPASQSQEAENAAEKIGILDEYSLSELVKGTFLSDQEQTTADNTEPSEPQEEEVQEEEEVESEEQPEEAGEEPEESASDEPKGVQKRINKLVAAKKQALAEVEAYKEKLAELESKLNEAPAQVAQQQDVSEAVAKLKTVEQVDAEWKRATEVLMWCEENPDGGTLIGPDGNEIDVDDRQVRSMKKLAIRRREIELPTRRQYLQIEREAEAQTVKEFPWWKDPSTKEYQTAQQVLRDFPEIKSKRADYKHIAGIVVLGLQAYQNMQQNKAATPKVIKKAPSSPAVKAAPVVKDSGRKAFEAFARNNGDSRVFSDLLKSKGFADI